MNSEDKSKMEKQGLIEKIAKEAAEETVQALALAQQMGMVNSQESLTVLIASGIETAIEEYVVQIENQSQIILNETASIRKDSNSN
jgi:hypothetical protein